MNMLLFEMRNNSWSLSDAFIFLLAVMLLKPGAEYLPPAPRLVGVEPNPGPKANAFTLQHSCQSLERSKSIESSGNADSALASAAEDSPHPAESRSVTSADVDWLALPASQEIPHSYAQSFDSIVGIYPGHTRKLRGVEIPWPG